MKWFTQKFELSRGGAASNVRPMEGLRGFAVFLVFLVHYVTLVTPWVDGQTSLFVFASALHTIGNVGVDLFFVLSGFLIYGTLISRSQTFGHFISRRIVRIYPAFIAVFAVYIFLSFIFPGESKIPTTTSAGGLYLILNFLLLPGLFPIEPMITVAWSLSYEMFYYLTIPLVIKLFKLRDRSVIWRSVFFLCLTVIVVFYCAVFGGHVRLIMFTAGILLYEALLSKGISAPSGTVGLIALVLGLIAMLLPTHGSSGVALKVSVLFVCFFILCLTCFRTPLNWLPRAFSWTPVRWLGNMSFSYYLLHGLTLKACFLVLSKLLPTTINGPWIFFGLLPMMFALTLLPASLLFLVVERPFSLVSPRPVKP